MVQRKDIGEKIITPIISCGALKAMRPVSVFLETKQLIQITQRQEIVHRVIMAHYVQLVCLVIRDTNK